MRGENEKAKREVQTFYSPKLLQPWLLNRPVIDWRRLFAVIPEIPETLSFFLKESKAMTVRLDELELISKKLTFGPDYTRFRSVCKDWRSAAPKHPQLPWLFAAADSCSKFYQFSFKANEFTQIPELSRPSLLSSFLDNPHVFIRSSHGWLFLLDLDAKSVSLINPLTDSIINLPNLDLVNESAFRRYIIRYVFGFSLTSNPSESLHDCFALVYYFGRIFYCKVGSSVWIEMQHPEIDSDSDVHVHVCCYRGKLFLAVGVNVFVCEFGDNPSICKLVSLGLREDALMEGYFVESDGDLLLVLVFDIYYRDCKVLKLEFGPQQVKLVKLKCLGDRTLFLSLDTTFSLVASKYPGCKKNSIYIPEFLVSEEQNILQTLIIYDCEEEKPIYLPDDSVRGRMITCGWFTPSLLM